MSETPPAGWYDDPENPERYRRYWDGDAWTVRQLRPVQLPPAVHRQARVGDRPRWEQREFGTGAMRLGKAIRLGLVLTIGVAFLKSWLYLWGLTMFDDAVASGDLDRLDHFDDLDRGLGIAFSTLIFVTAVCWMIWQYRLARSQPPASLRRGPGWHAWAWVVPVVSFWFPYQNVADLWRTTDRERSLTLVNWWWTCFVGVLVLGRISGNLYENAESVAALKSAVIINLMVFGLVVVAGVLAMNVVSTLNRSGRVTPATPAA